MVPVWILYPQWDGAPPASLVPAMGWLLYPQWGGGSDGFYLCEVMKYTKKTTHMAMTRASAGSTEGMIMTAAGRGKTPGAMMATHSTCRMSSAAVIVPTITHATHQVPPPEILLSLPLY